MHPSCKMDVPVLKINGNALTIKFTGAILAEHLAVLYTFH